MSDDTNLVSVDGIVFSLDFVVYWKPVSAYGDKWAIEVKLDDKCGSVLHLVKDMPNEVFAKQVSSLLYESIIDNGNNWIEEEDLVEIISNAVTYIKEEHSELADVCMKYYNEYFGTRYHYPFPIEEDFDSSEESYTDSSTASDSKMYGFVTLVWDGKTIVLDYDAGFNIVSIPTGFLKFEYIVQGNLEDGSVFTFADGFSKRSDAERFSVFLEKSIDKDTLEYTSTDIMMLKRV